MDSNSLAHTKWNCKYHIVFTPKNRRQAIYKQISADIGQIIRILCARKGVNIIEAAALKDHIHLYVEIPPKYSVSEIIENLLNAIQAGIVTSGTKERLESLEAQKENLQSSILQAQLDRPKYTKEEIVSWILQFRGGNIEDKAYQKEIIDVFLNSIYVYEDRMVFTYNYKDGAETIRKEEIEAAFRSGLKNPPPPYWRNPNLKPVGKGFGFLVFIEQIGELL